MSGFFEKLPVILLYMVMPGFLYFFYGLFPGVRMGDLLRLMCFCMFIVHFSSIGERKHTTISRFVTTLTVKLSSLN